MILSQKGRGDHTRLFMCVPVVPEERSWEHKAKKKMMVVRERYGGALSGPEGQGDFSQKKRAAHQAFPAVETRGPALLDTVLKKGLLRRDFWAIIGLPKAHFVDLFLGDSGWALLSMVAISSEQSVLSGSSGKELSSWRAR